MRAFWTFILFCASVLELGAQSPIEKINYRIHPGPLKDFIPDTSNPIFHPLRKIRIHLFIVRKSDKTGNFNDSDGVRYALDLVKIANELLANNQPMNLPIGNNTPALPTHLKYTLVSTEGGEQGVSFINEDSLYLFNRQDFNSLTDPRLFNSYGKSVANCLPIFLLENTDGAEEGGGIGMPEFVKMAACYLHFRKYGRGAWFMAGLLNHEIGHTLGLAHSWIGDVCDDTPDNGNCWNVDSSQALCKVISNNVMDYNVYQNAWTPCQLGIVHRNLSWLAFPARAFLSREENECTSSADFVIPSDSTITIHRALDLRGNLILKKRAQLIVKNRISLPFQAKIVLERNSLLEIDSTGAIAAFFNADPSQIRIRKKHLKRVKIRPGGILKHNS